MCSFNKNLVNVDKIIITMVCEHSDEMSTQSSTVCVLTLQVRLCAFCFQPSMQTFASDDPVPLISRLSGFTVALVGLSAWLRVDYPQDVWLGLRELLHQTMPTHFLLVRSFLATKELDFLTSSHLASYCCNFSLQQLGNGAVLLHTRLV